MRTYPRDSLWLPVRFKIRKRTNIVTLLVTRRIIPDAYVLLVLVMSRGPLFVTGANIRLTLLSLRET